VVVGLDRALGSEHVTRLAIPGGEQVEPLTQDGATVGRLVRRRSPLAVAVRVTAARADARSGLLRLRVRTENVAS
jgi:hypothetical protein